MHSFYYLKFPKNNFVRFYDIFLFLYDMFLFLDVYLLDSMMLEAYPDANDTFVNQINGNRSLKRHKSVGIPKFV